MNKKWSATYLLLCMAVMIKSQRKTLLLKFMLLKLFPKKATTKNSTISTDNGSFIANNHQSKNINNQPMSTEICYITMEDISDKNKIKNEIKNQV